jgi:hypothetical protein
LPSRSGRREVRRGPPGARRRHPERGSLQSFPGPHPGSSLLSETTESSILYLSRNYSGPHSFVIWNDQGISSMENQGGRIVETAVEARGGPLGRPVLAVLLVSTLLVIGMFAVIYAGYFN